LVLARGLDRGCAAGKLRARADGERLEGVDQQKERQIALDVRSKSTWRREVNVDRWLATGLVTAGLRGLRYCTSS
jgi:hypothetical protein